MDKNNEKSAETENPILQGLNPEQENAVKFGKGPLLIIAGAGTGKTSVITRRIAHLISEKKAKPSEILALTFTDKAAVEMEERVDLLVPYGFNDVYISTFHAFGDRILRDNALEIGISPDYHLLSPSEAAVFFKENLFSFPMKHYRPLGNPVQFIRAMLTLFSRAKDEDINPEDYRLFSEATLKQAVSEEEKEEAEKQNEISLTYQKYEELKRKHNFLDFGDQVNLSLKLLREHPSLLNKYQNRFKYMLVDEFQDTNYAQFELVKLIASKNKNITVVGDDDQSIYKFRGACLSNILNFTQAYPDAKQVVLRNNYRSTQVILDSSYKLISHNNPERLEIKNKINKELIASKKTGLAVEHLHFDTLSTESDEVARIIKERIKSKNYKYSDFAILVRANDHAVPFLKSLNMLGIPWRFSGSEGLYKREEIRLILSFLRVISNPQDSVSLHFFASSELYKFNQMELAKLNHIASFNHRPLLETMQNLSKYPSLENLSEESLTSIAKILEDINEFYTLAQKMRAGEVLYLFLKKTKILDTLYNSTEYREVEKAQNIAKFFRIVESFSDVADYDRVGNFIEHLDALLSVGDDPATADVEFDIDAVNVLTIHKAKGLEFPVVFMVSLVEDRFPSRNRKDIIELPDGLIKDILPSGDFHVQEERRLFYVGMTRAKDELYLTSSRDYGGKRAKKVSRFLLEAVDKPKADEEAYKSSVKETLERYAPIPNANDAKLILPNDDGVLKLSPYAVDDYLTCPLKYKYVHVLRVPILRHHTLVFGEVIHKVLKEYYRARKENKMFTQEDIVKIYDGFWSSSGFLSREHEDQRYQNGKEMLVKYFNQQEKLNITPFSVEEDFKFMLDKEVKITGRWDRLDERNNQKIIVDFKTTARVKDQKAADKEVRQSRQLFIYALGHKFKYGRLPDMIELHFLEPGIISSVKPTEEIIKTVTEDIMQAADGIRNRCFEAKPQFMACQYCAYANICPAQERQ